MEIRQARQLLGVMADDDAREIKRKFRKLMGQYHPDVMGSDAPENLRRAQALNEAYALVKDAGPELIRMQEKKGYVWDGEENPEAVIGRKVYMPYSMDIDTGGLYQQVAYGKYLWDPEEEEFSLFLRSVREAAGELLEGIEAVCGVETEAMEKEFRFRWQAQVFHGLMLQFLDPAACLKKMAQPEQIDAEGRVIYAFSAYLKERLYSPTGNCLQNLRPGDVVYPAAWAANRIRMQDGQRRNLGYLLLEEDALYLCLIPLLRAKKARIRVKVTETPLQQKRYPRQIQVRLELRIRLEAGLESWMDPSGRKNIQEILEKYRQIL